MKHYKLLKPLLFILLFSTYLFGETINLREGWNLVGANTQMTLQEIKNQVGDDNLLVIQGGGKTYKKDNEPASLNDFIGFEEPHGYWIKVQSSVSSAVITLPTITLLGDGVVNLALGDSYTDAGVTAVDDTGGDITSKIVIQNLDVNTTTVGTYTVTYTVSDEAQNSTTATRTVNVVDTYANWVVAKDDFVHDVKL